MPNQPFESNSMANEVWPKIINDKLPTSPILELTVILAMITISAPTTPPKYDQRGASPEKGIYPPPRVKDLQRNQLAKIPTKCAIMEDQKGDV